MTTLISVSSCPRPVVFLGVTIGLATFAACGETTANAPLPAARVEAIGGAALSGPAGLVLPEPIAVRVVGSDEQPLPGVTVTFSAGNGGSVDPASARSDGDGSATTRWTLGQAGPNVLTVTAGDVSTTITATATAGRPATVTLVAGDNQTAPAGNAVATAPSVRVADAFGNLVEGALVSFSVLSGGGRVTNGLRQTNSQGIATVGSWILGPAAGVNTLAARVEESGVDNNPVIFTATATPPTGAQMVATAGNNQSAPVGRLVPIPPTVAVRNAAGNGVPGVIVNFEVVSGGGSVVGSRQVTDATGTAAVGGWFLGSQPGTNTLRAVSTGLTPVIFTATGGANLAISAGNNQVAVQGTPVAERPTVRLTDGSGNPVSGAAVAFAVTGGGGSATGLNQVTDAQGLASVGSWTLGSTTPNTLTATVTASGASVTFTAESATQIAVTSIVASVGPDFNVNEPFTITVQLRNSAGVAVGVAGVPLTVAKATGSGTLTGTLTKNTASNGSVSFTDLRVTVSGGPHTFTITGTGLTSVTTTPSTTFNP